MSVWCTPDGRPFYGGTYYPNEDRHGMPSFARVCEAVAEAWRERRDEVLEHAGRLTEAIDEQVMRPDVQVDLSPQLLREAYDNVVAAYEPNYGGFGSAPKFPPSMTLEFLLRAYDRNASPQTLEMITTTLDAMAAGGMYDQVGGGFARYSTDDYWLVPHFEKMLYDNALLTRAYLHAFLVTGKPRYQRIVEETIEYVLRDLLHPGGRLLLRRGRRLGRDRRQVLPVEPRRGARGVRRRRRRADRATTASPRPGTSSIRTRSTRGTSSTSSTGPRSRRTRCSGAASGC